MSSGGPLKPVGAVGERAQLAPGTVLTGPRGDYVVADELGRGGFGITHRGMRSADGHPVVIKTIRLGALPGWKAIELFEREAGVLRSLAHPLVPAWLDDFALGTPEAPSGFALVMDLVPGPTLRAAVRAGGLAGTHALALFHDLLDVLRFLHERAPPLIHRDVNPKNVIVRPDGRAALVDFGTVQAALRAGDDAAAATAAGTFGYAPMEQFLGQASPRSDLYALGMTMLFALTGREPEHLPVRGIAIDVAAAVAADPRLVRLITGLTEPDPRARIGSAAEALRLLTPLCASAPSAHEATAGAGAAREIAPAGAQAATLEQRIARRFGAHGFSLERGGQLGQIALVLRGQRSARDDAAATHVFVARAEALAPAGKPLPPIPAALYVQAAADTSAGSTSRWDRLRGRVPLVVPVVLCQHGVADRTAAHVMHSLREPADAVVVPAFVAADGNVDVVTPRSLLAGDARGYVAQARRLLG